MPIIKSKEERLRTAYQTTICSVRNIQRLDIPDAISVLVSNAIHREESHAGDRGNRLGQPLLLILEGLVDHPVRGDVGVEIVRDEVVITVLFDRAYERGEIGFVAEHVVFDCIEDALQLWVQLEVAVEVSVAQVLDVFGEIAEEEDVLLADFAGDLDL